MTIKRVTWDTHGVTNGVTPCKILVMFCPPDDIINGNQRKLWYSRIYLSAVISIPHSFWAGWWIIRMVVIVANLGFNATLLNYSLSPDPPYKAGSRPTRDEKLFCGRLEVAGAAEDKLAFGEICKHRCPQGVWKAKRPLYDQGPVANLNQDPPFFITSLIWEKSKQCVKLRILGQNKEWWCTDLIEGDPDNQKERAKDKNDKYVEEGGQKGGGEHLGES